MINKYVTDKKAYDYVRTVAAVWKIVVGLRSFR